MAFQPSSVRLFLHAVRYPFLYHTKTPVLIPKFPYFYKTEEERSFTTSLFYNPDNTTSQRAPSLQRHSSNETIHSGNHHYHKQPCSHNSHYDIDNTSCHRPLPHHLLLPSLHPRHSHLPLRYRRPQWSIVEFRIFYGVGSHDVEIRRRLISWRQRG